MSELESTVKKTYIGLKAASCLLITGVGIASYEDIPTLGTVGLIGGGLALGYSTYKSINKLYKNN